MRQLRRKVLGVRKKVIGLTFSGFTAKSGRNLPFRAMPRGHPKFSEELSRTVIQSIESGDWRSTACRAAGITDRALRYWEEAARKGEEPYVSFFDELYEAESKCEQRLREELLATNNAAIVKARTWYLERRFTRRWGEAIRIKEAAREIEEERRPKTELALETVIGLLNDAGYTVTKRDDGD